MFVAGALQAVREALQDGLVVDGDPSPLTEQEIVSLIAASLVAGEVPGGPIDVGVMFVDSARIHELNRQHRNVDAPTDVLSFPIDGLDELPPGVPRQLGDIVVCTSYVRDQFAAGETMVPRAGGSGDTTIERAVARCIVHGVLHVLGEDHELGVEHAARMYELEEVALRSAGFDASEDDHGDAS